MLGPDWQQVQTLLPSLEPARARKLAKILAGRRAANAFLKRAVQTLGHERLKPWVQIEGEEHLRDLLERNVPVVLAPWHFGPLFAIGTALIKMDVPVLVLQRWPRKQQGSHIEYLHFEGSAASRVQTLKRGVQRLHGGGVVMTVVDVPTNETPEIPRFRGFLRPAPAAAPPAAGATFAPCLDSPPAKDVKRYDSPEFNVSFWASLYVMPM